MPPVFSLKESEQAPQNNQNAGNNMMDYKPLMPRYS